MTDARLLDVLWSGPAGDGLRPEGSTRAARGWIQAGGLSPGGSC